MANRASRVSSSKFLVSSFSFKSIGNLQLLVPERHLRSFACCERFRRNPPRFLRRLRPPRRGVTPALLQMVRFPLIDEYGYEGSFCLLSPFPERCFPQADSGGAHGALLRVGRCAACLLLRAVKPTDQALERR